MEKRGREASAGSSRNRYIKYYTKMHATGIHLGREGIWLSKRRQGLKEKKMKKLGVSRGPGIPVEILHVFELQSFL